MITLGDRRYRVRGLEKNLSYEQLRLNILSARGEAFEDIVRMTAGGEDESGDKLAGLAKFGHNRKAVFTGEHHIENHDIERFAPDQKRFQRRFAVIGYGDVIAFGFETDRVAGRRFARDFAQQAADGGAVGAATEEASRLPVGAQAFAHRLAQDAAELVAQLDPAQFVQVPRVSGKVSFSKQP